MRAVADTHAIVWFGERSERLTPKARLALQEAEATDGIVISPATIIDLWYVIQSGRLNGRHLAELVDAVKNPRLGVVLVPIDLAVASAFTGIGRDVLADPWDRLIVATAMTIDAPLVTADERIRAAGLVPVVW